MKITVDTGNDTVQEIKAAIRFLTQIVEQKNGMNTDASYPDREEPQMDQEMFGMFNQEEESPSPSPNSRIMTYD